jgi:integrase
MPKKTKPAPAEDEGTRRQRLTDISVRKIAPPAKGRVNIWDEIVPALALRITANGARSYVVQTRIKGRAAPIRMTLGAVDSLKLAEAREMARDILLKCKAGEDPRQKAQEDAPESAATITLWSAWTQYEAALKKLERADGTVRGYRDHVEGMMKDWHETPLKVLADDPSLARRRHDKITDENGPYAANGCMRTLRAVYNFTREGMRGLPPDNPTSAVVWNPEYRRENVALGSRDVFAWMTQLGRMRNPIRREFHLFTLLSGCRPGALKVAKVKDLNLTNCTLRIGKPKGGVKRAFDIPLSREMIRCLVRAMRASRALYPEAARTWIFAADSDVGHIVEHKENRADLSKYANDLRHTFRTLANPAGVQRTDMKLLMNHKMADVNDGYIDRPKLMEDDLRAKQEKLTRYLIEKGTTPPKGGQRERAWPLIRSRQIGDELLDPTPQRRAWLEGYASQSGGVPHLGPGQAGPFHQPPPQLRAVLATRPTPLQMSQKVGRQFSGGRRAKLLPVRL